MAATSLRPRTGSRLPRVHSTSSSGCTAKPRAAARSSVRLKTPVRPSISSSTTRHTPSRRAAILASIGSPTELWGRAWTGNAASLLDTSHGLSPRTDSPAISPHSTSSPEGVSPGPSPSSPRTARRRSSTDPACTARRSASYPRPTRETENSPAASRRARMSPSRAAWSTGIGSPAQAPVHSRAPARFTRIAPTRSAPPSQAADVPTAIPGRALPIRIAMGPSYGAAATVSMAFPFPRCQARSNTARTVRGPRSSNTAG